jgi:hypothetical protein
LGRAKRFRRARQRNAARNAIRNTSLSIAQSHHSDEARYLHRVSASALLAIRVVPQITAVCAPVFLVIRAVPLGSAAVETPSRELDLFVEESSQRPSRVEVPVIGRALDIRRALILVVSFFYRDDLLEFDRGDLPRAAQTVENWFGVPGRFGGLSLPLRRLGIDSRLKVIFFVHCPDVSREFAIAFI